MYSIITMSTSETNSSEHVHVGRVKWFNNKAGYGFITITDSDASGTDVFAHHSAISVEKEQYRYLVQGEYVNLTLSDVRSGPHEFQAGRITGINGGQLMCETLNETHRQVRYVKPYSATRDVDTAVVTESTEKNHKEYRTRETKTKTTEQPTEDEWTVKTYKKALGPPPSKPVPTTSGRGQGRGSGRGGRGRGGGGGGR